MDVNLGTGEVQVTLSVSHGILTLSQTSGLSFVAGSNGSGDMTVSGTLAEVNAALSTLTYTPFSNYYGTDSVQISADDLGNYGVPGPLEDSATIALTVTDIIDYRPVYDDSFIEQPTSTDFTTTVGPEPQLENLFSLLESRGFLPDDLSHENDGQSSSAFLDFRSLLFEALFGMDESHRNSAWDAIDSWGDQEKGSAHGEIWLGLEAFMARTRDWMVGKDMSDIRLVFNADRFELAEWFDSIMARDVSSVTGESDLSTGLYGYSGKTAQGMALVFNMDKMKIVDMLLGDDMNRPLTAAAETASEGSVSRLYEPDAVSLMDLLAS